MNYLAQEFIAQDPAAYVEECLKRARTLYLDGFACDWTEAGKSHKDNVELCVEGALSHLYFIAPEYRAEVARKLVSSWGSLDRSDEEPEEPEVRAPLSMERPEWPFPT